MHWRLGDSSRVGLRELESEDVEGRWVDSSDAGAGESASEDIDGHLISSSGVEMGDPSGLAVSELGSGDIDVRGLIWGVRSDGRR
jgi:hypothetical protein